MRPSGSGGNDSVRAATFTTVSRLVPSTFAT
jgi:hypothetical protein